MKNKKYCIFGASGFAREVYWLLIDSGLETEIEAFLVNELSNEEQLIYDVPVRHDSYFNPNKHYAIIAIGDVSLRKKIFSDLITIDAEFPNIIHPNVKLNRSISLGMGNIICDGCIFTCDIKMGNFNIFNLSSTIGHDCVFEDFITINPGVNISGSCYVGSEVLFGTNSSIRQNISIVSNVVIGMGSTVVKNITTHGTFFGNPAKQLK